MELYLSHNSALEFWRVIRAEKGLAGKRLRPLRLPVQSQKAEELRTDDLGGLSLPLHILVGSKNARKARADLCCHVSSDLYPSGSFIKGSSGLVVSSPELCFLQMADKLSFGALIELGFEFCGTYRMGNRGDEAKGFREDKPLTSVAKLSAYLKKAPAVRSKKSAQRALRFIIENSGSPRETVLAMLLSLPYKLGGFGFKAPVLNYPIEVTSGAKRGASKKRHRCDLYWPEEKVAVEYDSEAYHTEASQIVRDAIRRNRLSSTGIIMITVGKEQVSEVKKLHELAEVLRRLLNKRLRFSVEEFSLHHAKLRSQLHL